MSSPTHPADESFLTVRDCKVRAKCGGRPIYRAIRAGRLRAIRLNDRGDLRIHPAWFRAWIEAEADALRQQAADLEAAT